MAKAPSSLLKAVKKAHFLVRNSVADALASAAAVTSPPPGTPPLRRSVVPGGPRLATSRSTTGFGASVMGSDVVADQIEKQGAVQRGQEKSLQQLNAKVRLLSTYPTAGCRLSV